MSPLVTVDDAYDRDHSSDGISRFGAYVRQRAHLFVDDWEPLSPTAFAATVWHIASAPVMSPGYVRLSRDVWTVTCRHGDEPGVLVADVEVRLPWPLGLRAEAALTRWGSWARCHSWDDEGPQFLEPVDDRPALLVSSHFWVPIPEDLLPVPCRFGALDVVIAQRAAAVVCEQVNAQAGPVVAHLLERFAVGAPR